MLRDRKTEASNRKDGERKKSKDDVKERIVRKGKSIKGKRNRAFEIRMNKGRSSGGKCDETSKENTRTRKECRNLREREILRQEWERS